MNWNQRLGSCVAGCRKATATASHGNDDVEGRGQVGSFQLAVVREVKSSQLAVVSWQRREKVGRVQSSVGTVLSVASFDFLLPTVN